MDVKDTPIEITIGPYESYRDEIYGQKTAFEAYVTLRNPIASAALDKYKHYLRDMEANLPVPDGYKNFQRGFESPTAVVDQIGSGGEAAPGIQTAAFNLPNDERVREAKGAKKVILSNVLDIETHGRAGARSGSGGAGVQDLYGERDAVSRALAQPGAGLDREGWSQDDRRRRAQGAGLGAGGVQSRCHGRLEHHLHDEEGRDSRGRESIISSSICQTFRPKGIPSSVAA